MSSSKFALTGHADGVVTFHCPPRRYFEAYKPSDFARGGCEAQFDFKLKAGQLDQPFSMAEQLRKLGLPIKLEDGILSMTQDLTVCEAGQVLTPEQAKILQHFNKKSANFQVQLVSQWSKGSYESMPSG